MLYLLKQKICEKAAAQRKIGKQTVANSKPADKKCKLLLKASKFKNKACYKSFGELWLLFIDFNVKFANLSRHRFEMSKNLFFDTELFFLSTSVLPLLLI